jgi:chromosome segregation ATPase
MFGWTAYSVGYDDGRSDERTGKRHLEIVHQILTGERPATVDQSYIDRLHAALDEARANTAHNYKTADQFHAEALDWKQKADQFRNEALYWRDEKFAPIKAKAKALREEKAVLQNENVALREENAVLLARLRERNPDLAEERAAHDETFKEKQSLQRFRVLAASLIDALLAGRAGRPEFAEVLKIAKDAADSIERGDLFTAFRDEPEKNNRLCSLADALQKP